MNPLIKLVEDGTPLPKSPLKRKELREFQVLLLAKRAEVVGDVAGLTTEALPSRQGAGGESSSVPLHMADVGTDNWEQQVTLGLAASESKLVREIDEALERIRNGTYGICLATHRPIGVERLRAKPWARFCIEYARLRDDGRL